ncbi:MAG: hypothetical protein ISS23_03495 [Nanoarchaeota archaeon]|nr:hypothetical protein [Nanoarchaeota archaeon]
MVKIANNEPPTEDVISLRNQKKSNDEIVSALSQKGFSNQQISDAINQADIKGGVEGKVPAPEAAIVPPAEGMKPSALTKDPEISIPVPSPEKEATPAAPSEEFGVPQVKQPSIQGVMPTSQQPSMDMESVQEIVESIIDERWQEVVASVGDITIWKGRVEDDIASIKQEILRTEDRFSRLQASIIGKVDEYQMGITKVSNEMEALEKVFSKIMEPLTTNIKELQRITRDMKKK